MAIEIKAGKVHDGDLRGLDALIEDAPVKRAIVVSFEKETRCIKKQIDILPWRDFLARLWAGQLL